MKFFLQPSCIRSSSKVQSGVSQCVWNQSLLSCSLRPPPTDPIFTILVSLLTTIITVPILILVHYVLIGYASHEPGRRWFMNETEIEEATSEKKENTKNLTTAEKLRNSICSSPFNAEMKRVSPADDLADNFAAGIISQIAYAGMLTKWILYIIFAPITALACISSTINIVPPAGVDPSILHFFSI